MSQATVITGMDKLKAALGELRARDVAVSILKAATLHLRGKISVYPQSSDANKPRSFVSGGINRWYERGYGSKWARKDGSIGGAQTSQTLGRSWSEAVDPGGKWGSVGTDVSYAPAVQDAEAQAGYHKQRGWVTVQDVIERYGGEVIDMAHKAIDAILAKAG